MHKLQELGIAGKLLEWIRSFLTGRRQRVRVDGVMSEWIEITSGIPQGSVLGPILFVIFINDMPGKVIFNTCKLFADDSKHYGSAYMQRDLDELVKWSTKWQLNERKCKTLHLGNGNLQLDYQMNGHILEHVNDEKDLGVYIGKDLKFHKHTSVAIRKANQVLGIKKSFNTRDLKTISTLYRTLVRPHLEYGNVIWGPHYRNDIIQVESIQRRATKIIGNLGHLSYGERLRRLKLPSLVYRRKRGDIDVCIQSTAPICSN